jgi:hypothetical protein
MVEIGNVVSMSKSTDSLVFELNDDISLSPTKTVTMEPGSTIILEQPKGVNHAMPPPPPLKGADLIGFGASRCGWHGVVDCGRSVDDDRSRSEFERKYSHDQS